MWAARILTSAGAAGAVESPLEQTTRGLSPDRTGKKNGGRQQSQEEEFEKTVVTDHCSGTDGILLSPMWTPIDERRMQIETWIKKRPDWPEVCRLRLLDTETGEPTFAAKGEGVAMLREFVKSTLAPRVAAAVKRRRLLHVLRQLPASEKNINMPADSSYEDTWDRLWAEEMKEFVRAFALRGVDLREQDPRLSSGGADSFSEVLSEVAALAKSDQNGENDHHLLSFIESLLEQKRTAIRALESEVTASKERQRNAVENDHRVLADVLKQVNSLDAHMREMHEDMEQLKSQVTASHHERTQSNMKLRKNLSAVVQRRRYYQFLLCTEQEIFGPCEEYRQKKSPITSTPNSHDVLATADQVLSLLPRLALLALALACLANIAAGVSLRDRVDKQGGDPFRSLLFHVPSSLRLRCGEKLLAMMQMMLPDLLLALQLVLGEVRWLRVDETPEEAAAAVNESPLRVRLRGLMAGLGLAEELERLGWIFLRFDPAAMRMTRDTGTDEGEGHPLTWQQRRLMAEMDPQTFPWDTNDCKRRAAWLRRLVNLLSVPPHATGSAVPSTEKTAGEILAEKTLWTGKLLPLPVAGVTTTGDKRRLSLTGGGTGKPPVPLVSHALTAPLKAVLAELVAASDSATGSSSRILRVDAPGSLRVLLIDTLKVCVERLTACLASAKDTDVQLRQGPLGLPEWSHICEAAGTMEPMELLAPPLALTAVNMWKAMLELIVEERSEDYLVIDQEPNTIDAQRQTLLRHFIQEFHKFIASWRSLHSTSTRTLTTLFSVEIPIKSTKTSEEASVSPFVLFNAWLQMDTESTKKETQGWNKSRVLEPAPTLLVRAALGVDAANKPVSSLAFFALSLLETCLNRQASLDEEDAIVLYLESVCEPILFHLREAMKETWNGLSEHLTKNRLEAVTILNGAWAVSAVLQSMEEFPLLKAYCGQTTKKVVTLPYTTLVVLADLLLSDVSFHRPVRESLRPTIDPSGNPILKPHIVSWERVAASLIWPARLLWSILFAAKTLQRMFAAIDAATLEDKLLQDCSPLVSEMRYLQHCIRPVLRDKTQTKPAGTVATAVLLLDYTYSIVEDTIHLLSLPSSDVPIIALESRAEEDEATTKKKKMLSHLHHYYSHTLKELIQEATQTFHKEETTPQANKGFIGAVMLARVQKETTSFLFGWEDNELQHSSPVASAAFSGPEKDFAILELMWQLQIRRMPLSVASDLLRRRGICSRTAGT